MIPLAALMAIVILGSSALAVDISLQTHNRRTLQNVTDAAALAAAQDLVDPTGTASVVQTARQLAVVDAIKTLHSQLGFAVPNSNYAVQWAQNASCVNNGSTCYADNITAGEYTFSVDVPPKNAQSYGQSLYNGDSSYIEITLRRTSANAGFANVIGASVNTTGAHSIAYHQVPSIPFGFALYANTVVSTGNEIETVVGNTYAYRNIYPQAQGQAGFCAATLSDGSGGNLVLGSPQYPNAKPALSSDPAQGADQQYVLSPDGHDPDVAHIVSDCSDAQSGQIAQTGSEAAAGTCPTSVQGVNLGSSSYFDTNYTKTCVANPPVPEPSFDGPATDTTAGTHFCNPSPGAGGEYQPGTYSCTGSHAVALTVDHTMKPGIYHVKHNPDLNSGESDVVISGTPVSADSDPTQGCPSSGYVEYLCGVTFILDAGAIITVQGNGTTVIITPYIPPSPTGNDTKFPVYSGYGVSGTTINVNDTNAKLVMTGTVYMPSGSMNVGQNAFVYIQGQAIVNTWNVQSGNHPNPDILWDGSRVATEKEILRLVE
jgi:hypothetical protein